VDKKEFVNNWNDYDVELHWDRVANKYVQENNKVKNAHDQRFSESIKKLALQDGMCVLNISSRDAEANDFILKDNPTVEVINAEVSAGLMSVAKGIRPYIYQTKINSYSELPFESERFDRILTLETLEHVPDPLSFLSELHRIGKKSCIMVLSCPPHTSEFSYRIYTFLFGGHGEGPHKFPHPENVRHMLALTNWKLIEHYATLLIPVGPLFLQKFGEFLIRRINKPWISNLGIRQFYVCERDL
jgi:SAM-dependent methyltransferase